MTTWIKNKKKGAKEGGNEQGWYTYLENKSQDPEQECSLNLGAKASQSSGDWVDRCGEERMELLGAAKAGARLDVQMFVPLHRHRETQGRLSRQRVCAGGGEQVSSYRRC